MGVTTEIIESPLSRAELSARFRELCASPIYAKLPGKLELDAWGRITMSPANNRHGRVQGRLVHRLTSIGGGEAYPEVSILTDGGVLVPDVVWASATFLREHRDETPFESAPELVIEVVSPSNSRREMDEKTAAYLAAGAREVWLVYLATARIERFGPDGALETSAWPIVTDGLFE